VCAKCVQDAVVDSQVTHATEKDPNGSFSNGVDSYEPLVDAVHQHYHHSHDVVPDNVATGATLASGTTIGGNTAYHSGNENQIDAGKVGGVQESNLANEAVGVEQPVYSSKSNVPGGITKGETVFIDGEGLYIEDGT
jgi:hypothetical protein